MALLERILDSMATAARNAGAAIVTGDFKIGERPSSGGLVVNTAGVGVVSRTLNLGSNRVQAGDAVLVSGAVGDHEIAVLAAREELSLAAGVKSDCGPVWDIVKAVLDACPQTRFFRDPTRGGLGAVLNELTENAGVGVVLDEAAVPVDARVRSVCDMLGFDPLYLACEGRVVAVVPGSEADKAVQAMQSVPAGRQAAIVGETSTQHAGRVVVRTSVGGQRLLPMPVAGQVPRIC